MERQAFLEDLNSGKPAAGGGEARRFMPGVSQEALRITAEIGGRYHVPERLRAIFFRLTGRPVNESFALLPPFPPTAGRTFM